MLQREGLLFSESLIMAVFYQRLYGKSRTIKETCNMLAQYLPRKLGLFTIKADKICDIIMSIKDLTLDKTYLKARTSLEIANILLFRDLQFVRLGIPYEKFLENQCCIDKERIFYGCTERQTSFLSRLDHKIVQYNIFLEIAKMENIFTNLYFREKHQELVRANCMKYVDDCDIKIRFLKKEEDEKYHKHSKK